MEGAPKTLSVETFTNIKQLIEDLRINLKISDTVNVETLPGLRDMIKETPEAIEKGIEETKNS